MTKRKLKRGAKWGGAVFIVFILVFSGLLIINQPQVKPKLTWELGTPITLEGTDFFTHLPKNAEVLVISDLSSIDINTSGSYTIELTYNQKKYNSTLSIIDTTAPTAVTQNAKVEIDGSLPVEAFIVSIDDQSDTTVSYKTDPKFTKLGTKDIVIQISDTYGNRVELTVSVEVVDDLSGPVIEETSPLYVEINAKSPDYWHDTLVSDAKNTVVTQSVNAQNVKLNKIGVYSVMLSAGDSQENTTTFERQVHVVMKTTFLTMQAVHNSENNKADEMAQAVYDQIITDTQTQREKIRAVYDYLLEEMTYRSNESNDYNIDSYNKMDEYALAGFENLYGNCFNYASMAASLIDKIGLEFTLIKGEGYSHTAPTHFVLHYWIMVNVDGQALHFDPLYEWLYRRVKETKDFFLVNDSKIYDITHRWDTTLYP